MNDLISRQEAIDALHMHLMYRMGTDSNKKRLDDLINGVPSAEPRWIPVSERLPVVEEKVLVFQTYDRNCSTTIGYIKAKKYFDNGSYNGGYWVWFITDKNSKSMCQTACPGDEYVKGWMPLPKWEMSNDE